MCTLTMTAGVLEWSLSAVLPVRCTRPSGVPVRQVYRPSGVPVLSLLGLALSGLGLALSGLGLALSGLVLSLSGHVLTFPDGFSLFLTLFTFWLFDRFTFRNCVF